MIGLGTWQLGADWGDVSEADAMAVLDAALANGVTLFDTADVYGDGRSEQLIAKFLRDRTEKPFVATKMGRRLDQVPENEAAYPEFSMFGELPAWGLYVRHASGIRLLHCAFRHPQAGFRPSLVFDDVKGLEIGDLKIPPGETAPAIVLKKLSSLEWKEKRIPGGHSLLQLP